MLVLTPEQKAAFGEQGFLLLRNFYDVETEIAPILRDIYAIIGLYIAAKKLPIVQKPFSLEEFDSGFNELIAIDRSFGGHIYDAVKQIPGFIRLLSSEKHCALFRRLRDKAL